VLWGKITTTELSVLNLKLDTSNPLNQHRTSGGHSAGSAAAVTDFRVPLNFGTQAGGSVIRPASYPGIFATKPSFGTVSVDGNKVVSPDLDTTGYFSRSLADLQLPMDVLKLPADLTLQHTPSKVGFVKSPFWKGAAGLGTTLAMEKAFNTFWDYGVKAEDAEFPEGLRDATALDNMFKVILVNDSETSFFNDCLMGITNMKLHPEVRALVEHAPKYTDTEVRNALDYHAGLCIEIDHFAANYCVLITPIATDEASLA
jgi:amidase